MQSRKTLRLRGVGTRWFGLTFLFCALVGKAHAQNSSSQPSPTQPTSGTGEGQGTTQPETAPLSAEPQRAFTGSYQSTLNASVLGKARPSLGHRFNLSYVPKFGGTFDSRFEYFVDGSFNADPPGTLKNNINEPKFEAQLMYSRPLGKRLGATGGLLYHDNFRFPDRYVLAVGGLTLAVPIGQNVTVSGAALVEKKSGVRLFYNLSSTLEFRFAPKWNTQLIYSRLENVGQFDIQPTQVEEYEIGLNRSLTRGQAVGVSFFRHIQFGAPNDQFSFLKFKYAIGF